MFHPSLQWLSMSEKSASTQAVSVEARQQSRCQHQISKSSEFWLRARRLAIHCMH